jgi:hypothetical protein
VNILRKYTLTIRSVDHFEHDQYDTIDGDSLDELAAKAILLFTQLANRHAPKIRQHHYATCPLHKLECSCNDDDIPF